MNNILYVDKLSKKRKGDEFSLNSISFTISSKEIIGFIGKNGAGKSTTIKTILNGFKKTSGNIYFDGENIDSNQNLFKENIGVVFDDIKVQRELTPKQLNNVFKNIYKSWNSKLFFENISKFKLPENQQVQKFSRGMTMKLSLSIALSHEPKLLILDEATAGLDPSGREEVLEILEKYVEKYRASIFMSSHITSDIESIADKLIFIKNGDIVLKVNKSDLIQNYSVFICSEDEYANIQNEDIVARRLSEDKFEVVTSNKSNYPDFITKEKADIDDITKIIMRGEVL
ncbi:ABC transporter ATP-binding protein [Staphylococcus felis]|uniref:ABC transporter ATP-binding protein n=1 Tax=Staphylococcus felis TaxID=46127 RepID=UPI0024809E24|nr:ABC transporter ATP-binding protein [Staphylococcus felis]